MNLTAVIEVTEKCNLACSFCLRPSFNAPVMSIKTLSEIIREIVNCSDYRADFIWHGGEPLVAGLDFFREIPEMQKRFNSRRILIRNNVQTNATLLDKDFIEFFERECFEVGTSIQGTREIHDKSRITKSEGPTYQTIVSNIRQLKNKPSGIVVLTRDILGNEAEVYHSMKPLIRGMRVSEYFPGGVNPENCLKDVHSGENLMPSSSEYGESMIRFYEVWKSDKNPIDLKPITEIIRSMVVGKSEGCLYSQEACNGSIVGIKSSGEFYTCIMGSGNRLFCLGNVKNRPLAIYKEKSRRSKEERTNVLQKEPCADCSFWNYCNGGCPLESYKLHGDLNHNAFYCEGRKMLFNKILNDLRPKKK